MPARLDELRERIAHAEGRGVVLESTARSTHGSAFGSALGSVCGAAEWLDTGWEMEGGREAQTPGAMRGATRGATRGAIPLRAYHELAVDGDSSFGEVFAPIGAVVSLLERLADARAASPDGNDSTMFPVAFIGEWCWPHADALREHLWREALWVRARDAQDRGWCAEQVLRESTIVAVVVDARGFPLTATRRLHLASRRTDMPPALVVGVRTAREIVSTPSSTPSAATTRWLVRPTAEEEPRWRASLVRSKVGGVAEKR